MSYQPYKNWTKQELKDVLLLHVGRLNVESKLHNLWIEVIEEAFFVDPMIWTAIKDFNGCSVVQDAFHPCPACFVHDYLWISGQGGAISDRIFYNLMIAEGMTKGKARRRWIAVRIGWFVKFRWYYIKKRNWNRPSFATAALDKYFKNK